MANELTITIQGNLNKTPLKETWNFGQRSIDVATVGAFSGTLSIGTTAETIAFTDISANGYLFMKNLDQTNYVTFGPDSAGTMIPVGRLKPNEEACFRLEAGITFKVLANTAACKVKFLLIEN